ncbi:MAG: ethylbenzene dehydrogenase-related protein [Motiliproteus sp.]
MSVYPTSKPLVLLSAITALVSLPTAASEAPADTYFSVAVSENSHNHYGENLLFLDFQEKPTDSTHPRTVISPRINANAITLDGIDTDWHLDRLTTIPGRVMNNYPLSDHYDATPTAVTIGSAYDDQYVYFMLQWEDANHDASIDRNRWVYDGQKWVTQPHTVAKSGTPAANTVNRLDTLGRGEDEDQVFMMFPIIDTQGNFKDGSLGCAGYCHTNLTLSVNPKLGRTGDGASSMHTAFADDIADLWHWTATRSRPMNTLKDGYLDYGDESYNGRKVDAGSNPFRDNAIDIPFSPRYVNKADLAAGNYQIPGYRTESLGEQGLAEISADMSFAKGVTLPYYIGVPATGSRADVETAANYNPVSNRWTLEIKRKRETADEFDHQFIAGKNALPPTHALVQPGDPEKGAELFKDKICATCHGELGEGVYEDEKWLYPRNQRVSGPAIRKTTSLQRPKRLQNLAHELKKWDEEPPEALMPFVPLTPQEAEDIAAWLQQQFTPQGE